MQGKAIVLVFASLILAAAALFLVYAAKESGQPEMRMTFEHVRGLDAASDASALAANAASPEGNGTDGNSDENATDGNATDGNTALGPDATWENSPNVTVLPYKPVHAAYFLEDHLDTATLKGDSTETVRLRIESMRDTLLRLTGKPGPEWWVQWEGQGVHITLDDPAAVMGPPDCGSAVCPLATT